MKTSKDTYRKFVNYLNNSDQEGGYWLPNIQRPFVWKEEQIEKLFDSLMREYPIGTLLIWKTKSKIKRRKFIDLYKKNIKLSDYYIPEDDKQKMLVLDGQQRLQSLFIGLKGSFEGRILCINILSGDLVAPEDIKYKFKFIKEGDIKFPFVKLKSIVFNTEKSNRIADKIINDSSEEILDVQKNRIIDNVTQIVHVFTVEENLVYQIVDSVDNIDLYGEEDIVEIFIRANSGGTPLGKSDLLFSLLIASWDEADENIEQLLETLNKTGYKFTKDFILKVCLTLLKKGSAYEVSKFRNVDTKQNIIDNWTAISSAILCVKDYVYGKTFIKNNYTLTSYLSLIPLIYFRYHYPAKWDDNLSQNYAEYVLKVMLTGAFSSHSDNIIDSCTKNIDEVGDFIVSDIFALLRESGRNTMTESSILDYSYNSKNIHVLFNFMYSFNYECSYNNNQPEIDHIFPQSELKKIKTENVATGRWDTVKYKQSERDQIANCMLLSKQENGISGKTNTLPEIWFENKDDTYLELHCIPKDKELWKIENFEKFIEERKKLLLEKLRYIIS